MGLADFGTDGLFAPRAGIFADTDYLTVWGGSLREDEDFVGGSNFGFYVYLAEVGGFGWSSGLFLFVIDGITDTGGRFFPA